MIQASVRNVSVLSYANGYTAWHYGGLNRTFGAPLTARVTLADVHRTGFFDPLADMLSPGDTIMASCADGGVLLYVGRAADVVAVYPMCATAVLAKVG